MIDVCGFFPSASVSKRAFRCVLASCCWPPTVCRTRTSPTSSTPTAELRRAGEHAFWPLAWTVCCKTPRARGVRAPRAKPLTWNRWCASRLSTHPQEQLTGALAPPLAAYLCTSASAVARIWRAHGLKPHRVESFKLSNDPRFIDKLEDIVGLYLDPPEHALVLCCDEKTQIQALDRTQPGLPLKRGRGKTMTHDYKRNGVTTLFAALNMLTGQVLSMTNQLHRHQEWLRFLKMIDRQTPKHKELHLIVDNYATHKHPEVLTWLAKHPRFHMHFTPVTGNQPALLR